ncbi:MAG: cyanophycin synthetase [Flavisolibacter sp.]|jgi:cyanophycin synthetase|nr:cyanophycin synthetase [Flavisolibacter sp.]
MKLIDVKILRGPNFWSVKRHHLIQLTMDLEEMEFRPTNTHPDFKDQLQLLLPSLYEHRCSEGVAGGFFERVDQGTWMGHVIEHIAIELQNLAGMDLGFGQTRGTGKEGVYHIVYEYVGEDAGVYAGKAAIRIVEALIANRSSELMISSEVEEIKRLWNASKMGPSTASIVKEAKSRNIPVISLDGDSLFQLGYGCRQKRIEATITSNTGIIATDLAGDKDRTKQMLLAANIPAPAGGVIASVSELQDLIEELGYPIVIKPLDGNHGNGATINIESYDEALTAFKRARKISDKIVVEKYIAGKDFRVLLVNKKFIAAALRTPAMVIGDGRHTLRELIDKINQHPGRGFGHDNMLTKIDVDDVCIELLQKKGYNLDSILPIGEACTLKPTANLSTGGTAMDVTEKVHPKNIKLFERAARTIGLDICGIDVMAADLSSPITENGGAIIEINAAPGFRMHLEPTVGQPKNVAAPVLDMLFPLNGDGRIPLVAVTGTNGKTTTTRLIAHIAGQAGLTTGFTTTDGIYIDNDLIEKADCSGPGSAQMILKDSSVEFAVLETARGGILRSGLGFDACDTAIVTNVAEDHLGLGGIDTIEKLARVKSVVPETVLPHGYAILNADDDLVYAMKENLKCNLALFSLYSDNYRIEEHCSRGGLAAYLENGYLILRLGNQIMPVEEVKNVPLTFNGKAEFNIANALAAILAAYTHNIRISTIRKALQNFIPSQETTPGRMNIFHLKDFSVLLDYAHNPHGLKALGKFIKTMEAASRIGVITGVGDRRDEDIVALAEEAARIFDEIIIRHDNDLRGRTHEEIDRLLTEGIRKINMAIPVSYVWCECDAVEKAIKIRKPNALIVVLIENITSVTECINRHQQEMDKITALRTAV